MIEATRSLFTNMVILTPTQDRNTWKVIVMLEQPDDWQQGQGALSTLVANIIKVLILGQVKGCGKCKHSGWRLRQRTGGILL